MKLGCYEIMELGNYISNYLKEKGINDHNELIIKTDKEKLIKIDEDLYYRNNPNGKDFLPSDNEIEIKFPNLIIEIKSQTT